MKPALRAALVLGAVAALVAAAVLLPVGQWLLGLVDWVRGTGALGVAVFAAAYVVSSVLLVPGTIMTLAAGFLYGTLWGTAIVVPASMAAAVISFELARAGARGWIIERVRRSARVRALDRAVSEQGWKVVLLLRLTPVMPFSLLNYGLGLTGVGLWAYSTASLIGMFPGTVLYVYLGSLVPELAGLAHGGAERSAAEKWLLFGGLGVTAVVTIVLARLARRALRQRVPEAEEETE